MEHDSALPGQILLDLFNVEYERPDVAVDYLIDQLESMGCVVGEISYGLPSLPILFTISGYKCVLLINRCDGTFSIEAASDHDVLVPINGNWSDIIWFIAMIRTIGTTTGHL